MKASSIGKKTLRVITRQKAVVAIIVMMFILNVGHIFYSDFGLFYQVTQCEF